MKTRKHSLLPILARLGMALTLGLGLMTLIVVLLTSTGQTAASTQAAPVVEALSARAQEPVLQSINPVSNARTAPRARMATFVVDTTTDSNDAAYQVCSGAAGDCSLRGAISKANAAAGDDTITLPAGTYTLTLAGKGEQANATGDLDITQNLTINGAGVGTTIIQAGTTTGNGIDRVLHIDPNYSGNVAVTLNNLTIQHGKLDGEAFGAGILNRDTLTLNNSVVKDNQTDSTMSGSGGGIASDISLTLNDSTVISNTAHNGAGGGIFCNGTVTLTNSTVSGNTSNDNQGFGDGKGGGVFNNGATLTLNNSTVSGNQAGTHGGGIFNDGGTLQLNYSTVANNTADSDANNSGDGGGIYYDNTWGGATNVKSSLIGDNSLGGSGSGPDCSTTGASSSITSQDYNLIEATTACTITGVTTHDVTGQDPSLAALADNGGSTQTHALPAASPAIDQIASGTNDCGTDPFNADQRGVS